jgi:hypothetical protein
MNDYPGEDKQDAASYINKVIEKEILRAPEQYLWVHRRLKPARWANLPLLSLPHRLRFQNRGSCVNVSAIMFLLKAKECSVFAEFGV